jgi:replicative DNA helicase
MQLGESYGSDFEDMLIKLLLFDTTFADLNSGGIEPEFFSRDTDQTLVDIFHTLRFELQGRTPASYMIASELKVRYNNTTPESPSRGLLTRSMARIAELGGKLRPINQDRRFVQDRLSDFVTKRSVRDAILGAVDQLKSGDYGAIRDCIEEATIAGATAIAPDVGLRFTNAREKLARYVEHNSSVFRSPLDIEKLDNALLGGVEPGRLVIALGPAHRGKTLFMVHVGACTLLRGKTVVHITLEDGEAATSLRYDGRLTGIPVNEIRSNLDQHRKTIIKRTKKLKGSLIIRGWGPDEVSVTDIRAYLRMLELREKIIPDLVIVDYIDLLRPYRNQSESWFELRDTVRALKQLGADFRCPIVTASQTNREGFDAEDLNMSTIATCIDKVNVADIVIGLCQTPVELKKNKMRLSLLKNRQSGKAGTVVDIKVNMDTQHITQAENQRAEMREVLKRSGLNEKGKAFKSRRPKK